MNHPAVLPNYSIMDSVYTMRPVPDKVGAFTALVCRHSESTEFLWIDHRAGPGSFADNWFEACCVRCKRILTAKKEHLMSEKEREHWNSLVPKLHEAHRLQRA